MNETTSTRIWAEAIAAELGRIPSSQDILDVLGFDKYELWLKMRLDAAPQMFQWIDEKYMCDAICGNKWRFRDYYRNMISGCDEFADTIICVNAYDIRRLKHHAELERTYRRDIIIDYNSVSDEALVRAPSNKRYIFANPAGFEQLHLKSDIAHDEFVKFTKKYNDYHDLIRECRNLRWRNVNLNGEDAALCLT